MNQIIHYAIPDQFPFNSSLYNESLACIIYEIHYNNLTKIGTLTMSTDSCCDMTACINLFTSFAPDIQLIQTYAGLTKDTTYILQSGEWKANL